MDRRGVSQVIGAIFLFAIAIVAFSTYQAFVVPDQNAGTESEHLDTIDQQMQDLRNAVVSMPGTAADRSLTFRLGTTYTSRTVAVNPPDPSGTFRTAGTQNASVNLTVANEVAELTRHTTHQ
jgi:FlaG/FlaF family flagellin (archaellin)